LSKQYKIKAFIFGSSSSVYGKNTKIPFSEDDKTDSPISPYAATKKAGEVLCHTYNYIYGLNIVVLRFFTVYGPRGRPDMAPYLFTKNILEGKPITVFGDGSSKRDYTYISDIVEGIISALNKDLGYQIFNLGDSKTISLKQLISIIEQHTGKKAKIIRKEMPKEDVPVTYADISKAKRYLNYSPVIDIKTGMKSFINWFTK
jgi:UDP-glucuronate 4-epimerase